ncbi:MAG: (d)CMP kinase [Sphaerochaetaceae bacterium]|nr:(d)CMP kinase [Sphaerochaetaceae bacterium]
MIVAIDGPAGSGKSSIAKMIAKELGYYFLNTGSFYRAITRAQIDKGLDPMDRESVLNTAKEINISVEKGNICIDGKDVEDVLHGPDIDKYVSQVSSDPRIRNIVDTLVRDIAKGMDIVTEGRDTTTVVFPNAECKFYFDATPEIRAERRIKQHPEGQTYEEVLKAIKERDYNDKNKPVGALKLAEDAIYVDTSLLTIKEVCEKVIMVVRTKNSHKGN